jgi:hypothetical protein
VLVTNRLPAISMRVMPRSLPVRVKAPPAVMNALIDALSPLGISEIEMPATREKIWRAMRDAGR